MSKKSAMFVLGVALCAPAFASGPEKAAEGEFISEVSKISEAVAESKAKYLDQRDLEDLLIDKNPQVRKAAVKNSRAYILNNSIHDKIVDILENKSELLEIRVEAARVLSYATAYNNVREALTETIKYNNQPRELRVMAYKALWTGTNYSQTKDFLLDAVKYEEKDREAQKAAVWALFAVSNDYNVRDVLMDMARNSNEAEDMRVEAIKSLYNGMGNYDVKDKLTDIAKDQNERKPVRLIAIKALSGANNDSSVKRFLEETVKYDKDQDLRIAALWASAPERSEINELFHLGYKVENGPFVNPIEKE